MTWDTIDLDIDDDSDVATITVDRPEQLNALTVDTLEAIEEALADAEAAGARALVFAGAGDGRSSRAPTSPTWSNCRRRKRRRTPNSVTASRTRSSRSPRRRSRRSTATRSAVAPELALACDLRVAAESAVIGQTEIDLGIIPGWGGTQRLSRLVGDETAKRLVFLGERIDASEAADIGLVGEVVADDAFDDRIDELSRELAAKPAFAMRAAKEALNAARDGTQAGGLALERRAWSGLFGTHDQREGMAAFLEKREPDFE